MYVGYNDVGVTSRSHSRHLLHLALASRSRRLVSHVDGLSALGLALRTETERLLRFEESFLKARSPFLIHGGGHIPKKVVESFKTLPLTTSCVFPFMSVIHFLESNLTQRSNII